MARKGENIYKRKDGRWEGRYVKGKKESGKVHYGYIYGTKYSIVKDQLILKKFENQTNNNNSFIEYDGNFQDWTNYWLELYVRPNVKQSTFSSYKNKMNVHVIPIIGHLKLESIRKKNIEEILKTMAKTLQPSSIRTVFSVLQKCFNQAVEHNFLFVNVCTDVELPKIKRKVNKVLSIKDQEVLVKEANKELKYFSIILALNTGLRIGEICGLKWEDIDFVNETLEVNRTILRIYKRSGDNGKTIVVETMPKSYSSHRKIPMTSFLMEKLTAVKKQSKSEYVISNKYGALEPRTVSYRFKTICEKCGIKDITFHSLRRTFATRCLELGGNIAAISSLLGHSSTKMTLDFYVTSFFEEEKKIINKLNHFN
ncbi:tyrosine-type recombinase/integrase [Enterococcus sp. 5H]|uniref:tyrosine-type recombinase/integrase n=1 Tax=Enterococcus sp. 5H TaxID=1229490 RepID=UPI0023033994|nr:site-specific integrase [Enterococcus sp. 5H]MDA9470595.1 site-specific recombinase, phage integrase family [Enterococcus sp. 5H]